MIISLPLEECVLNRCPEVVEKAIHFACLGSQIDHKPAIQISVEPTVTPDSLYSNENKRLICPGNKR